MNLSELIKKNNEEKINIYFQYFYNNSEMGLKKTKGSMQIEFQHFIEDISHSLLNNILEYIEGEKMSVKEDGILKDSVRIHNQALQLIEEYITEALTK